MILNGRRRSWQANCARSDSQRRAIEHGCCTSVGFYPAVALDLGMGSPVSMTGAPAFWQGYEAYLCAAVPTHSGTWGALKSVYR